MRRQAVYPAGPLNRAGREGAEHRRNVGDTQKHAAGGGNSKEAPLHWPLSAPIVTPKSFSLVK